MNQTNLAYAEVEPTVFTVEQYLAFDRAAETKHEYYEGEIVKMAGASDRHNLIASNTFIELGIKLRGTPCRVFGSDTRTRASLARYVYPDVVVICGARKYSDAQQDVLLNPTAVFEVLSKSTAARDRGAKLESYLALESVADYVLIDQDRFRVEHYARSEADWKLKVAIELEQKIILDSISCEISLAEIYADVQLPPANLELI